MKIAILMFAIAAVSGAGVALAYDDDMMGTMVNGRMGIRDERSDRVRDPEMDREEMIIDREKRQGRNTVAPGDVDAGREPRQPFQGDLPD